MESEIIAKFKYNKKEYYIEYKNNKIVYYYVFDGKKIFELSDEEKNMIEDVLDSIIPSKDISKLIDVYYKNNKYEIFIDRKTKLKMAKPYNDELYYLLNNQSEYLYDGIINNTSKDFFKRVILDRFNRIIIVLVSCAMLTSGNTSELNVKENERMDSLHKLYTYERMVEKSTITEEEVINRLTTALEKNILLKDKEREAIRPIINIVARDKKYVNLDYLEEKLLSLHFIYLNNSDNSQGIKGVYETIFNIIYLYNVNNIEEVDSNVLYHELCHVLGEEGYRNSFLLEATNSIFMEDSFNKKETSAYTNYYNVIKMLMEIIGAEPFKKYQYYHDDNIIINALCEIINDRRQAEKLLSYINFYENMYFLLDESDPAYSTYNLEELNAIVYKKLGVYYKAKYNRNMNDDLLMVYYMNNTKFNETISSMSDYKNINSSRIKNKEYFDEEKPYDLMISDAFCIDESNRYLDNNETGMKK